MQSLRPVRGMHWNRLFAMRLSGTLGEVRIRLAAVIGLVSLGLCATGSAQTGDAQSALVEAQRLEGAGNPAAALESYRWALDASRPESPERATALLGMATVETAQGKYPDARRHAADASRLFDRLRDSVRASLSLNRQGLAALNAGDYDEAGEMFAAALERSTKAAFLEGQTEQPVILPTCSFIWAAMRTRAISMSRRLPSLSQPGRRSRGSQDAGGSSLPIRRRSFNGWAEVMPVLLMCSNIGDSFIRKRM